MWSMEFSGRASSLNAQQRVLFPVTNHSETTRRQLSRGLLFGICTGVALLTPEDARACHVVHEALHSVLTKNPLLSRSHFAVVVETGLLRWTADQLEECVKSLLQQLQLKSLDMLLLRAQTLAIPESSSTYERKRIVLQYWEHMIELQTAGLVSQIGVSGFSIQQTEFILMAYPHNPPVAFSVAASLSSSSSTGKTSPPSSTSTRLATIVAFAHGHAIDVLVRFPIRALDTMALAARDRWKRLAHAIAHKHREQQFQVAVTNEADKEPFQMHTRSMADAQALQSPLQIAIRYLLQKGLVVIPIASSSEEDDQNNTAAHLDEVLEDEECQELFYTLLHPFTALMPAYSPNKLYSSLVSSEDIAAIDQTLHLGYCNSFPPSV